LGLFGSGLEPHPEQTREFGTVANTTSMTAMLLILTLILEPFVKLSSFRKWDNGTDTNPEDEIFDTAQHQDAILKYVENEYCA